MLGLSNEKSYYDGQPVMTGNSALRFEPHSRRDLGWGSDLSNPTFQSEPSPIDKIVFSDDEQDSAVSGNSPILIDQKLRIEEDASSFLNRDLYGLDLSDQDL